MHSLLQIMAVSIAILAFSAGVLFIVLWAFSMGGGPNGEMVATSYLWSWFWPLIWAYRWTAGKVAGRGDRRTACSGSSTARLQVGLPDGERPRTIREAKEHLAGMIVEEAKVIGAPLTEIEKKMLYFSEGGWTLPDMKKVGLEFSLDYDHAEYEQKIGSIISRIQSRLGEEDRETWERALRKLADGDHYLLVLVEMAAPNRNAAGRGVKLLILALVFLGLGVVDIWFRRWLRDH